jgi:hypothetical protein
MERKKFPRQVAHVTWKGGSLWLPADTPYACEVLGEYVRRTAQSRDQISVHLDRHRCSLSGGPLTALRCVCTRPARCWMSQELARRLGCTGQRFNDSTGYCHEQRGDVLARVQAVTHRLVVNEP